MSTHGFALLQLAIGTCAIVATAGVADADRAPRGHAAAHADDDDDDDAAPAKPDKADKADKGEKAEKDHVTLADVLSVAIRRSPDLTIARSDRNEGRDKVDAADAVDEWHVLGRTYGQDSVQPRSLASAGTALSTQSIAGEIGLDRSLSTGGDLTVAVATSQVNYLYPLLNATSQVAAAGSYGVGGTVSSLRLTASQPVVRGAGEATARADQKLAKLQGHAQTADSDDEAASLVRDLVFAYWELAYATSALTVDRESEALAVKQVGITQDVVRNGAQPPSAIKLAEMQVALRREAILRDEGSVLDRSLALRKLAGYEIGDGVFVPVDEIVVPTAERKESDVITATLAHGPGIAQKKLAQRGAEVLTDATNNATLPRVDLSVSADVSGVGASVGEAFGNIGTGQMYTLMGGVSVVWDIGGAERAAAARAEVHRARVDIERSQLDQELRADAISVSHQLARARQRAELSQVAVDAAAETLRSELVAFSSGRSTNVAVFQRQDDLSLAKLRLSRARIDAVEADLLVDFLSGSLLSRFGITMTERSKS